MALLQVKGESQSAAKTFCEGLAVGTRAAVQGIPTEVVAYYFDRKTFNALVASDFKTLIFTLPGGVDLEMIWVGPGSFMRGMSTVTLTKGYWLGKYPFTQKQWEAAGAQKEKSCGWLGDQLPVENVTWDESMACCQKLNERLKIQLPKGYCFMLPTEAQWEFATRGGMDKGYEYSGSDTIDDVAWYDGNSSGQTHSVGQKQSNELGFYDMSGNVWEWCSDWYDDYPAKNVTNPTGPCSGLDRVIRGGSWYDIGDCCTCAFRNGSAPAYRGINLGFRVALASVQ